MSLTGKALLLKELLFFEKVPSSFFPISTFQVFLNFHFWILFLKKQLKYFSIITFMDDLNWCDQEAQCKLFVMFKDYS